MRSFLFQSISLYSEQCIYIVLEHLSNALSKLKCLAAKYVMFEHTQQFKPVFLLHVHVQIQTTVLIHLTGLHRHYQKGQLSFTIRGCWLFTCIYTDVAKTTMGSFCQVKTAFSSNSCKPRSFSLLAATLAKFFNEEIF